jgi:hypothetical protein
MDEKLPDRERRAWSKTYAELSERRRILQNKPLPGSYVHEKRGAKRPMRTLASSMLSSLPVEDSIVPASPPDPAP